MNTKELEKLNDQLKDTKAVLCVNCGELNYLPKDQKADWDNDTCQACYKLLWRKDEGTT